ncbi:helix-turn-helix domain-containing protein [Companilactobacillus sp.]|uniref:helix-turn-helix domain-containing protein n=1 Tax=Companilactobacillus sp. TaxID=2767905 RepID=UPI0025C3BAD4|nr:AraC family transcriptional regulator [Companilactobacillus sp.]MCH4009677.1 AraC family transcriptional regulator [Companilactobacillus sp.]MCH4052647.1 AraC family transcriptional regulator [Companilactobacillus sp.]MCH4077619.1 AraC family transcriptional regulator [Companilactobacillus sp.]MCH4126195.1 AraC family transcriptional regulator [Companilactobacillus sp.]MCI1311903.1 AraC family transcriptional regulator [Companilactobacillus sp.]
MRIMISDQFQDFMKSLGIDLNDTLQRGGVNKVIWKENIELNDSEYWKLMNELDNELSDETIVNFSDIKKINSLMPSFFAALSARNGAEAIQRLADYKALVGPVKLNITKSQTTTSVQIVGNGIDFEVPRFTVMTEQLLLLSLLRVGTSEDVKPVQVASKYQYGKISNEFGIEPLMAKQNTIEFLNEDLQKNFISANNVMWEFIRPELDRRKLEIQSHKSLVENLQALLLKKIPSGEFGIDEIADSLNISRRTLQRSLKNLNTSFTEQVKIARQSLIEPFMKDASLDLVDVSYLLGYSDPESFSRAFKSWYEQSPSAYRKQLITK